jgi:hypothetical protein
MILNGAQAVGLPKEGSTLEFKSLNKTIPVPFVIYADLEALLKPLEVCENDEKNGKSFTIKTHEHITCSYGYKVVCFENDKYSKPFKIYRGIDAVYKFFEDMFEEEKQIDEYMREFYKTKMIMNKNDWSQYNHAKTCYVCYESFTEENKKS